MSTSSIVAIPILHVECPNASLPTLVDIPDPIGTIANATLANLALAPNPQAELLLENEDHTQNAVIPAPTTPSLHPDSQIHFFFPSPEGTLPLAPHPRRTAPARTLAPKRLFGSAPTIAPYPGEKTTGLTENEWNQFRRFVRLSNNIEALEAVTRAAGTTFKHFQREKTYRDPTTGQELTKSGFLTPRSFLYDSNLNSSRYGINILLKRKGVEELGCGSTRAVTKTYNLSTGLFNSVASFFVGHSTPLELELMERIELDGGCPFIVTGEVTKYFGWWQSRNINRTTMDPVAFKLGRVWVEKMCLHTEYCSGGNLYLRLNPVEGDTRPPLTQLQLHQIVLALIRGYAKMHGYGVIHSDIKEENVLLTGDDQGKVGDLGGVRRANTRFLCGAPTYMSPEMYSNYGEWDLNIRFAPVAQRAALCNQLFNIITVKSDVWSFGWMLLMVFGTFTPGQHPDDMDGEQFHEAGLVRIKTAFLDQQQIANPNHIHYWINRCLQTDSNLRPAMNEMIGPFEQLIANFNF